MEDTITTFQIVFTWSSIVIGFIVACIYYVWYIKTPSKLEKKIQKAKENGNIVTATCVKTQFLAGRLDEETDSLKYGKQVVTYEYVVNGKKYKKKYSYQLPGSVSIDYPYTLKLYYDEKNPRKVYTGSGNKHANGYLKALGVWILFVFIAVNIVSRI